MGGCHSSASGPTACTFRLHRGGVSQLRIYHFVISASTRLQAERVLAYLETITLRDLMWQLFPLLLV